MAEVYHNNIIDIDLESGTLFRSFLNHTIGSGDNNANWYGVRVFRKGEPIALSGCSVQGLFMPASGSAILISDGTHTWVSGNEAAVLLPQACYNVKGQFTLTIKIIGTNSYSITDTVRIIDGVVADTYSENPVAPTAAVPTYQEILAVYDQMVAAKEGSVRFDIDQTLTAAQMTQARGNIEAASESDVSDLNSALNVLQNTYLKKYLINLYDDTEITENSYFNANGDIATSANWAISDFMPVNINDWFVYQGLETVNNIYLFYDIQKNKLSDRPYPLTGVNTLVIPSNAAYVRFSIQISDLSTFKLYRIKDMATAADVITLSESLTKATTDLNVLQNTYLKKYLVNLYDDTAITSNSYFNANGDIATSANWAISDFMPVNTSDWFVYQGLEAVNNIYLFYDVQKNKLSDRPYPLTGVNTLIIPSKAAYVRFSIKVSDLSTFKLYRIKDMATAADVIALSDLATNSLTKATTAFNGMNKQSIRKRYKKSFHNYSLPSGFSQTDFPIAIITDGTDFMHNFSVTNYKNTGGTTYYVSPNGTGSGLYYSNPGSIQRLFNTGTLNNGDTIILLDGLYRDMALLSSSGKNKVPKNINLIAEHTGKATIANIGVELTWTATGNEDVYSTTRSNTVKVAQLLNEDQFITTEYKKVTSLSDCVATMGSWYLDGSTLYVHTVNHIVPTYQTVFALLNYNIPVIDIDCSEQNVILYLEGINFLGGTPCTVKFANTASHTNPILYAKNCNFLHGYSSALTHDAVSVLGGDAYFENCRAEYSSKDGFNYHASNDHTPKFIEIDCVGANNGLDGVAEGNPYQNGSTAHDGVKGIRIGGTYYNNYGANVADVNADTETINLLCTAFDSAANTDDKYNSDFCVQQIGAYMILQNCMAFGSKYSAYCVKDGNIDISLCDFDTVLHDTIN